MDEPSSRKERKKRGDLKKTKYSNIVHGTKAALPYHWLYQPIEEAEPLHDIEEDIIIAFNSCHKSPFVLLTHSYMNDLPADIQ